MKGINYRVLMNNWDTVVEKICDEMTPHDVLRVVAKYVQQNIDESKKHNLTTSHLVEGHRKLIEAMIHLDPEQ